jgi:hypothetical protein
VGHAKGSARWIIKQEKLCALCVSASDQKRRGMNDHHLVNEVGRKKDGIYRKQAIDKGTEIHKSTSLESDSKTCSSLICLV